MNQHLPKEHYARQLLEAAAYTGSMPSGAQLDKLEAFDLPDGENLSRFRSTINNASRRIVEARAGTGYGDALDLAGEECGRLADRMSPNQLAATDDPNPESFDSITARMFNH